MESNLQQRDEDVFVTAADLAASRPPPDRRSGVRDLIRNATFQFIAGLIFILFIIANWAAGTDIKQSLIDTDVNVFINQDSCNFIGNNEAIVNEEILQLDENVCGSIELSDVVDGIVFSINVDAGEVSLPGFDDPVSLDLGEFTYALSENSSNLQEGLALGMLIALPFFILVLAQNLYINVQQRIPFFRNIAFLRSITEVIFLLAIITTTYTLIVNLQDNFADPTTGLRINFQVLQRNDFGVEISQGPDYQEPISWLGDVPLIGEDLENSDYLRSGTYTRALMTGIYNTLRVVSIGLVVATVLGVLVGVGLLSGNWLIRAVSTVYVEIFRNTPLLVQLFLVYGVWTRILPGVRESIPVFNTFYLNNRGLNYPKVSTTDTFTIFAVLTLAGFVIGVGLMRWRGRIQERTGAPAYSFRYFSASFFGLTLLGLLIAVALGDIPFSAEAPERLEEVRFNFERGDAFTAEFVALLLSLVLYTAAFIADIVRAGIQSVPKGQIEAARAAGLSGSQTLRLIVLPQAFRLIVPPLTNQYLNLSKNSSLALAIGYVDLFSISQIATNQSGQAVVFFAVVLVLYLLLSLIIALVMNLINRSLQLQTR
jgi:general L-amino acid transport system permease protein